MLLPVALNRHLVCIFCLLQNFTGSWKHNRKIKPWNKKRRKAVSESDWRGRIEEKVKDLAPSEEIRRLYTPLHKVTYAFWEHVLWEQGLNIWPLSCTRMKALEPVSSVTYLPSCCLLELILRRREASLVAHMVKNLPVMQETQVWSLGQKDPLEKGLVTHSSILASRIPRDGGAWWAAVYGVAQSRTRLKRLSSNSSRSFFHLSSFFYFFSKNLYLFKFFFNF